MTMVWRNLYRDYSMLPADSYYSMNSDNIATVIKLGFLHQSSLLKEDRFRLFPALYVYSWTLLQ